MAKLNPFAASTKYFEHETGMLYYGLRYYSSSSGRWLSRDPIEESDIPNIYAFVGNEAVNTIDYLGLDSTDGEVFVGPFACQRNFARAELSIPPWIVSTAKSWGFHDAKLKFNIQATGCSGCCRNGRGISKTISGRADFMIEGEVGSKEVDLKYIVVRAGWYFRAGGNAGVSFGYDACHDRSSGGGVASVYAEFGLIFSAKTPVKDAEAGGRGGINGQAMGRVTCSRNGCDIQGRFCASFRMRLWVKAKIGNRWWEFNQEAQVTGCTPWSPIYTITF